MKASEYGGPGNVSVGFWSFSEPGNDAWNGPHLATKAEAIAAGRAHYGPAVPFEVGLYVEAEVDAPDADDVIDTACVRMCEIVPSDLAEGFLDNVSDSERAALTSAIERVFGAWLTDTGNWPQFCKVANIELIQPEAG